MKQNDEFKQQNLSNYLRDYDGLKGKVVDKVAFNDRGCYDEHMLIITFTDKTFICVGLGYVDDHNDEMELQNNWIYPPGVINGGDYRHHIWVDDNNNLHFDKWIQILIDLGIWELDMDEAQEIIKKNDDKKEQKEYEEYLRLKAKFEKHDESN